MQLAAVDCVPLVSVSPTFTTLSTAYVRVPKAVVSVMVSPAARVWIFPKKLLAPRLWWSREVPPYRISAAGLHHPLTKPCVHLSMYTASPHYSVLQNFLSMNQLVAAFTDH